MKFACLSLVLVASLLVGSPALEVIRKQPLSSSDKQAVGQALTKALQAMQNHAGGSKWEACAGMFPDGKPPADQKSATWQACKNEFYSYAGASLVQGPLSSGDKQAVGEALTKALSALKNHAGGSKWEACAGMFPNGQPPADPNTPTWLSCKSEFVSYAGASLVQQPLSSRDKQAVGEALSKALNAMQNHAGSKYGACADMFPDGKPPADANSPTWAACKSQFYAYAAAALVGTKTVTHKGKRESLLAVKGPLSSSDKQAVGEALTKALGAMQNHQGSKYGACADMFPDGKPPADQNSPTWVACRGQFYAYAAASLVQQPLSSSDKQAVGEALTKALGALQHHGGGSKYEACADMFPNGKPPADQNSPTWVACKGQFYNGALLGTKSVTYKAEEPGAAEVRHSSAIRAIPLAALLATAFAF